MRPFCAAIHELRVFTNCSSVQFSSCDVNILVGIHPFRFRIINQFSSCAVNEFWHCPHGEQSRITATVWCPSVCAFVCPSVHLSVCPTYRPLQQRAEGLLLNARQAGDMDRLLLGAGRPAAAARSSTGLQQQMRAVPRCQLT